MLFKWDKVNFIFRTVRHYTTAKQNRWTVEESEKLVAMVQEYGRQWRKLEPHFPNRTSTALSARYKLLECGSKDKENIAVRDGGRERIKWTKEEDRVLLAMAEEYGSKWTQIAFALGNRNASDVMQRYHRLKNKDVKGINEGPWSIEETEKLAELLEVYGEKWNVIAKIMKTRTADQCRYRHRYEYQHEALLEKNKSRIAELVKVHGNDFERIAQELDMPQLTSQQISTLYWAELDPNISKDDWSESELLFMMELVKELDGSMELVQRRLPKKRGLKDMCEQYRKYKTNLAKTE